MTKEQVFQIMGKYYGNEYYRSAIAQEISENDLRLTAELLDKINSFGYNFSNTHRLVETEDKKLVPIILTYFDRISAVNYRVQLLSAVRYKSYEQYVPHLLEIYATNQIRDIKVAASEAIMSIRSRKYTNEYLKIVGSLDYGKEHDWLIELLCKFREPAVLPKMIYLLQNYPQQWEHTFLRYAASFKDSSLIPYVSAYLNANDSEKQRMARQALKKLEG